MNFVGAALPLGSEDVKTIAGYLGCHIAALRAVLAVESNGKGFSADKRPIILSELHIFYRELDAGAKRDGAVRDGLAFAKHGYHTRLANAYGRRPAAEKVTPVPATAEELNAMIGKAQKPPSREITVSKRVSSIEIGICEGCGGRIKIID